MNAASSAPTVIPSSIPAHNVFKFDDITFSSNFDNGNLARVERTPNRPFEFRIWTAPDNMGTENQSKHCAWFYFTITGAPMGCVLRIQVVNASGNSGLWKHDMRPVYKGNSTNQRWVRIKSSVRFQKEGDSTQVFFEHGVDSENDKLSFAFTYPYTYTQIVSELDAYDAAHINDFSDPNSLFYQRELLTKSCDGRRVDLLTITSIEGMSKQEREPLLSGLFPETMSATSRPPCFPSKEVVFISSRVHAGEVPASHTFKGIINLLMDPDDPVARELRSKYLFKLIPILNPDGVYRGHFRMDQHGQNLNRYYTKPDPILQPSIFASKSLLDYYASTSQLSVYLDFHAHASKRGCFIYGNILESIEDQIQNQLFCKMISLHSPHFDYEGCLFSKEHMFRIDPGDQAKGLTAEGSGRVATYLAYGLIHSYTIECNYNTSRIGNEIPPAENEYYGPNFTSASPFTTNPEKYTPSSYYTVGRACVIALLELRSHNPCSRIPKSKFKSLERIRNAVMMEVKNRREYFGKQMNKDKKRVVTDRKVSLADRPIGGGIDDFVWKRLVEPEHRLNSNGTCPELPVVGAGAGAGAGTGTGAGGLGAAAATGGGGANTPSNNSNSHYGNNRSSTSSQSHIVNDAGLIFISAREMNKPNRGRRLSSQQAPTPLPAPRILPLTEANLHAKDMALWAGGEGGDGGEGEGKNVTRMQTLFLGVKKTGSKSDRGGERGEKSIRSLGERREGERSHELRGRIEGLEKEIRAERRESIGGIVELGGTESAERRVEGEAQLASHFKSMSFTNNQDEARGENSPVDERSIVTDPFLGHTRELIKEQNIAKSIRSTAPHPPKEATSTSNSAFSKRYKDNRKILGKTRHAAGVALLIGSNSPALSNNAPDSSRPSSRVGIAYLSQEDGGEGEKIEAAHSNNSSSAAHLVPVNPHLDLIVTGLSSSRCSSRGHM